MSQSETERSSEQAPLDDGRSTSELIPLVYAELRALAHGYMKKESHRGPLQTTAVVHEAYLRLARGTGRWKSRQHFLAAAAGTMRRVLVDLARKRLRKKREGNSFHMSLDEGLVSSTSGDIEILVLHDLMNRLGEFDGRKARVIELRLFAGLTIDETATVLGLSHATVERDLKVAKAWLARELRSGG